MKFLYPALVFICVSVSLLAQDATQRVTGKVKDALSGQALAQANASLYQDNKLISGSASDAAGIFIIENVAPGRYKFVVSYAGYESYEEELLVISGKKSHLEVALRESSEVLDEVVVSPADTQEPMTTSLSIEKTMRVPANFFDPVRMLSSYPGVVTANDQSNAIVVKGYSPNGILWRLQGLDIVSPNHLANAGTLSDKPVANGGGVNVLSAQLLDKTTFYSGSLPANYGNALSGVMDMTLRPGDAEKMRYTLQASVIGLDAAVEGPINKSKQSSFLANYRYSTVGLLSEAGVDFGGEQINFQDFSFHLNAPGKRGGNLSVFGLGGISSNRFKAKEEMDREEEKDNYTIDYEGEVYAVGFVNQFRPGKTSLSIGASVSNQHQERMAETNAPLLVPMTLIDEYKSDKTLVSAFFKSVHSVGKRTSVEWGINSSYLDQSIRQVSISSSTIQRPRINGELSGALLQPYAQFSAKLGKAWNMNAALRYVHFTYNSTSSVEPRVYIARTIPRGSVGLSYGITSQMQQAQTYLVYSNESKPLSKAHQLALEWKQTFAKDLRMISSVYYHQLFDVPGSQFSNRSYSTLNQQEEIPPGFLSDSGKGRNYGIESLIEKKFYGNVYFMISGSLYESLYRSDVSYTDTRFNGKFTSSFLAGKEWKKENKSFGVHARVLYLGGLREAPIDVAASYEAGTTVYDYQNGYTEKLPNYFRTDLRISWRKNKPGYTRTLSIDVQNLTGQQNTGYRYYDTFLREVKTKYQVGLIPVLAYRVEF